MRPSSTIVLACLLALPLLAGCRTSIHVAGVGEQITAADGFKLTAFRFAQVPPPARPVRGLVFYLQGSEDQTVTSAISALAGFCAMNAPVIAVERRGVTPNEPVDTQTALRFATRECRIADAQTTLEWGTRDAPPGRPVVLLGASEGGDIASALAPRSPKITHVILLASGGGWTQEEEFRHFIRATGSCLDMHSEADLDARIADIRAHPDADTMWAGHPYRRWSTFMFARAADDLLKLNCPILVVHGNRDDSVPIESARALRDAFTKAGKTNLTLVEIPGVDHRFMAPEGGKPKLPLVEVAVVRWLSENGVLDPREVGLYLDRVRRAHRDLFPPDPAR